MGIAGLVGGLNQAKALKAIAKKQAQQQQQIYEAGEATRLGISQKVEAQADIAQQQTMAAEQARMNVIGMLGKPGTYDVPKPAGPFGYSPLGLGGIATPGVGGEGVLTTGQTVTKAGAISGEDVGIGILRGVGPQGQWKGTKKWSETGQVLDPEALTQQITGTAGFRMASRAVAEAEQLMSRTGPLWEELNNSITGGIYHAAAASQKEMMSQLSRDLAAGGYARNAGMRIAQAMRVQERVNTERTNQLWQAKTTLEQTRVGMAAQMQDMAQAWVENQAGIRDAYTNALTNLETFWSKVMPPNLLAAQVQSQGQMANNIFNAGQNMAHAVDVKYNAIVNGTNSIVQGIMNPLQGQISGMMPGGK